MSPRPPLTPELRRRIGLPVSTTRPYPWPMALLMVLLGVGPLWMAGYRALAFAFIVVALGVLPALRWLEQKEHRERERLYHEGKEGFAVVTEVEPAGERRNDHLVRLEIFASGAVVKTSILGSPLARKGLGPGDDVRVIYDPQDPRRCLLIERTQRPVLDAEF